MAYILIVDDLPANRKYLVTLLRHHGHRTDEAADGSEGLAAVKAEQPDLVITDVLMPVMDGYEFVRQLRLDAPTSRIPVVFYTAHYSEREARELALSIGVSYLLTKPAASAEVLRIVGLALAGESEKQMPPESSPAPKGFDRAHLRLVTDKLSDKVRDLETANERLRALFDIGLEFASERNPDRLLQSVCDAARDLFGATYVTLGILGRDHRTVQRFFTCGSEDTCGPGAATWVQPGDSVSGILQTVVVERKTMRRENPGGDPARLQLPAGHPEVQSFLAAPIASSARVYGWMCLVGNEGRSFTEDDEHLIMALSGQVGRIYELEYEILERKQAESSVRHERDRAQQYLDTAEVILLALDLEGRITLVNRYACSVVGWTEKELLGRDFIETCVPARIRDETRQKLGNVLGGPDSSIVEIAIVTRSGEERMVEWRNTLRRNDAGRVISTLSSGTDITERKRAAVALGQSETRKASILDSVLDCIVTMDADGIVIEFNPAAERTFGYTKAEAIGRRLADLIIPPPFRAMHTAALARYLATGEGRLIGKLIEVTAVRSDGSEIPVELTITAIRSDQATIFTGVLRDITARKQADETRARLAAIVDSSDDAIFSTALDDTILTWNAGAERMFGYTASEVIGRSRTLLVPAGNRGELTAMLEKASRGQAGEPFETQRERRDGSIMDISLLISPMTDATGRVTGASTIARDITGRKKAEAELKRLNDEIQLQRLQVFQVAQKRSEELELEILVRRQAESALRHERDRAQRFLDTAEVIMLALDTEGRITLINRKGCDLLGRTEPELLGRGWVETCLPLRIREALEEKFQNLITGDLSIVENPILSKSGEERLIEWRNTVLRNGAGQVTGTFSSGADITDRHEAVEALRTAEERMRFALQSAGIGIWDMDYTTGALGWSETSEAHYGLQPGTFGGRFEAFIERVHPDDRESLLQTVGTAMKAGSDFTTQHRAVWPDGTVRWLTGAGRILLGEQGEPVRGIGISMDVTERRSLEEQYQQAQKMEAVGRLAGGIAHDFNNLLTAILGYCDLLLVDLKPNDPLQADIEEIQKAGTRAAGLTRQLLAFSRKQIIEPKLLDLNVIVADMQAMLGRLIGEDVMVVVSLRPNLAPVLADRGQMEQIVMNLAVNARDAMPRGGTLTIETANVELDEEYAKTHLSVKPGPHVALTVTDTGTGMTPQVQAHLFEPFFTTKEQGKGTGLGLATVHGIVTQSGGNITVSSEVGRGTSFKVYFPRSDAAELVVAAPAAVSRPSSRTHTVLVVEDEERLRPLTKRLLEQHGYTVLVAASADEALWLFERNLSIDVVLTDVVMPGASGPELTRKLVEQRPTLNVIYMSGYTEDAIVHHGVLDSGITFLNKPFTFETLGRKLREVLDQ